MHNDSKNSNIINMCLCSELRFNGNQLFSTIRKEKAYSTKNSMFKTKFHVTYDSIVITVIEPTFSSITTAFM